MCYQYNDDDANDTTWTKRGSGCKCSNYKSNWSILTESNCADADNVYEMIKDYIRQKGELEKCWTISSHRQTLQFILDVLITDPKGVMEARKGAIRDAPTGQTWHKKLLMDRVKATNKKRKLEKACDLGQYNECGILS